MNHVCDEDHPIDWNNVKAIEEKQTRLADSSGRQYGSERAKA